MIRRRAAVRVRRCERHCKRRGHARHKAARIHEFVADETNTDKAETCGRV